MKRWGWITLWITSLVICWYVTKVNVKPEVVIQKQNVYIERLKVEKKELQEETKEKSKEIFWVRIRSFFVGAGTYAILTL